MVVAGCDPVGIFPAEGLHESARQQREGPIRLPGGILQFQSALRVLPFHCFGSQVRVLAKAQYGIHNILS